MLPVPWAVGGRGQGLTEGQHMWGHRLVSQPSQRTSSLFQSPSGPSSRYSKGPRAGASPWPATPGVQAEPLLSPWGLMGGDRSCLILSVPGRSPEAGRTLRANTGYWSGTVPQDHPDQTPLHHGPQRLLRAKPRTSHRRGAAPPSTHLPREGVPGGPQCSQENQRAEKCAFEGENAQTMSGSRDGVRGGELFI